MTYLEKKTEIARIKKIINSFPTRKAAIKFTYVEVQGPFLQISHTAGAYDGTKKFMNDRLLEMGIPTTDDLKEMFEVVTEKGDCKNHYFLELRMKAVDRDKVKIVRARKMGNITNNIMAR
jgi:hypothetical protein